MFKTNLPCILFIFMILLIFFLFTLFFNPVPDPDTAVSTLSNLQEHAIDIMVEMNKLLISFSLLIIGGVGGFLIHKHKDIKIHSMFQIIVIILCMIFASLSVYFGYVLYFMMIEMLSNEMFDPYNNMILQPQQCQYYSFILSVVLFALFAINIATREVERDKN